MSRARDRAESAEVRFSITDEANDSEVSDRSCEPTPDRPEQPVRRHWAVAAVAASLALAVGSAVLYAGRGRAVVTTRVLSSPGRAAEDLTGCPPNVSCLFGSYTNGNQLFEVIRRTLPKVELIEETSVFDADAVDTFRTSTVARDPSGLIISVVTERQPGGGTRPAWSSPIPAAGPATVALVRPGAQPGSSILVSAQAPAGVAVPRQLLDELLGQALAGDG